MTLTTDQRVTALGEFMTEHTYDHARDVEYYPYSLPQSAERFGCSDELIRRVSGYYFSEGAMRTFKTHIHELYDGRILVVSNRYSYAGAKRHYRVVWAHKNPSDCNNEAHVKVTVNDLETHFSTLGQARTAAKRLAALTASI